MIVADMVIMNQNPRASDASCPKPTSEGMIITMRIVTIEIKKRKAFILKWLFVFIAINVMINAPGIITNESSTGSRKSKRNLSTSMK